LGRDGGEPLTVPLETLPAGAAVMDMVYRPLRTPLLVQAETLGNVTVDGLAMLIGQAIPSFEALFGRPPPTEVDPRAIAVEAMR
jgi:shikimate dehydrogenase